MIRVINCGKCGKQIVKEYSGRKYCPECSKIVRAEREAARVKARQEKREEARLQKIKESANLEKYLKPFSKPYHSSGERTSICFDCENYAGGCCWTEVDPVTNKVRFEPVPGWTATRTYAYSRKEKKRVPWSYYVKDCPLHIRTKYKEDK